jgi:hypothetical protein
MTRNVGLIDFIGTSGGFLVPGGSAFVHAAGGMSVASSGLMQVNSQNGDMTLAASGLLTLSSLEGQILITATDIINIETPATVNVNVVGDGVIEMTTGTSYIAFNCGEDLRWIVSADVVGSSNADCRIGCGNDWLMTAGRLISINNSNETGVGISGLSHGYTQFHCSGQINLFSANRDMSLRASGAIAMVADTGGVVINSRDSIAAAQFTATSAAVINPTGLLLLTPGASAFLASVNGNTTVTSQSYLAATIIRHEAGPVKLQPWAGSGQMEYIFGPHQGWAVKPSYLSTFQPVPYSGQIVQMLLEVPTLQTGYAANNAVAAISAEGDLLITAATAKVRFGTTSTLAPIMLSGMLQPPATVASHQQGDFWHSDHSMVIGQAGVTTEAIAAAQSLGIGTLAFNTGSGIANISIGSGIAQFVGPSGQTVSSAATVIPIVWSDTHANQIRDQHFAHGSSLVPNSDIIRVMVPGLYRISYSVNFSQTTAGTAGTTTNVRSQIAVNGAPITIGRAYAPVPRVAAGQGHLTLSADVLLNFNTGDTFALQTILNATANSFVLSTVADECWLIAQYIGPKR